VFQRRRHCSRVAYTSTPAPAPSTPCCRLSLPILMPRLRCRDARHAHYSPRRDANKIKQRQQCVQKMAAAAKEKIFFAHERASVFAPDASSIAPMRRGAEKERGARSSRHHATDLRQLQDIRAAAMLCFSITRRLMAPAKPSFSMLLLNAVCQAPVPRRCLFDAPRRRCFTLPPRC